MLTSVLDRATMRDALTIAGVPEPNDHGFIRCVFHRPDDNPSLHLVGDPGRETGYKCHACHASGGVFDFLVKAGLAPDRAVAAQMLEKRLDRVPQTQRRVVASFIYDDGDGHPVARIDRIEPGQNAPKSFLPYLAVPNGFAARPGLNGMKLPVYRRTDVLRASGDNGSLFFTEGEGKADALRNALPAGSNAAVTTIAFGAGQSLTHEHAADLAGARSVMLLVDSDAVGREAGKTRAQRILEFHADMDVRIVDLYPGRDDGSDIADWLKEGHTIDELHQIVNATTRVVVPESPSATSGVPEIGPLTLTWLSDVEPEPVEWLWRSRIPRGKITLLVGDPGTGKSYASLAVSASVTNGTPLPDSDANEPQRVLIWNGEDGTADTIRPRASAVGASLERLGVIDGELGKDGKRLPFGLRSIAALKTQVEALGNVGLVVVDPISALLAGVDAHRDSDVRASLQPLADFAEKTGTAVLVIAHLNKKQAEQALYRVGGSIGFVGLARSVLLAAADPEGGRRVIAPLKCNLAALPKAVEYRIDDEGKFWWGSMSNLTAERLLSSNNRGGAVKEAEEFLKRILANGPQPSSAVEVLRKEARLSDKSVDRARKSLRIISCRSKADDEHPKGVWMISLPDEEGQ